MSAIGYYLALPFIYFISILPFPLFYLVSDAICFLVYRILGYRKKVVFENLKNSFPEKSHQELKAIERKFYIYLCDVMLETLKSLTISKNQARNHCKIKPSALKVLEKYETQKQSYIIVLGHFGSWEWATLTFPLFNKQQLYGLYHPLSNKYFDRLIKKTRTRFGTKMYPMQQVIKEMLSYKNTPTATAFIADQTPPPEGAYWMTFLNQDTPVFVGTEKIAQKFNYPIVYASVKRIKRGYYEIDAEVLTENPKELAPGIITEMHTKRLEKDILAMPETWLWSHRRWKHKRKVN
jgi:Kdo2-lipid IVA lauroyltransferase/acyltransferase